VFVLWLIRWGFWWLARLILPLRYRIQRQVVSGESLVVSNKDTSATTHHSPLATHPMGLGISDFGFQARPVLFLPNHPGYIDPIIMMTLLWPRFRARPLLWEGMFLNPFLYPFLGLIRAVRIPDLRQASGEARQRTEQALAEVVAGLGRGENFIVWPAGHAERDGSERLGAARAAADILRAIPDATVVLARTRGVWGSSFSYAFTGRAPSLGKRLLQGVGFLVANLLVFMPRRPVQITLERIDRRQLPELRRETINPWLEEWYNRDGPEKPTFVPYHFLFGRRTHEYPRVEETVEVNLEEIKPETKQAVSDIVSQKLGRALTPEEQQPTTTLDDLGLDSLDGMELTLAVEKRFDVASNQVPENLGQLWALAQGLIAREPPKPPPPPWFKPLSRSGLLETLGDTIPEAFVHRALAQRRDVIVADDLAGPLTYERLLVGVRVLSRRFAELRGDNVGLLLPASVAADTSFLALLLAGKLPVLLNWTTGEASLSHAVRLMNLTHVITSRAFVQRTKINVPGVQYLFLEDLRQKIGKLELLTMLLKVRWLSGFGARVPSIDPHQPALVLFTSGSERAPKAVPLTHANILSDMRAAVQFVGLRHQEVLLGFLPPFHSFGIAAGVILPILGGMRVVHHPDPTDAAGLARKITAYRVTMLIGTPTFTSYIFERSRPSQSKEGEKGRGGEGETASLQPTPSPGGRGQGEGVARSGDLDSLRLIVVGAEKCPPSLYDRARQLAPQAEVLEGYGVTECSPVVAVNRPGAARPGTVGQPLPGVEVQIVDVDTEEKVEDRGSKIDPARASGKRVSEEPSQAKSHHSPLSTHHSRSPTGMLWVSGPTVFPGYIGYDGPSPFRERDGKRWYVTGDLAEIDADGYIRLAGRLTRFLKAGGEMISLPALEEPFTHRFPPIDAGPRVAVEGVETDHGRRIVLFTTEQLSLSDANALLQQNGFRGVMRLDEVRRVESLPLLGTGKVDYKVLRAQLTQPMA
jgi:long-chain-fatty-acid--[acyl-carrier-protein] ligase